jgi:hypothetical protein
MILFKKNNFDLEVNGQGEYRRCNQEWTIQRNWQHWVHKTQDEDKQSKKYNTICVEHHWTQKSAITILE